MSKTYENGSDVWNASANSVAPDAVPLAPIVRLLLKPEAAAAALGISPRLLWSLTKSGEIPAIHLGKAVRYSPKSLAAWIEKASYVDKK